MEYNKIIAVTGLPGLYELLSSKSDGAIVRSLDDKSTRFVSSRIHNFSHLESIEVYTVRDNVNLVDVLKAMEGSSEKLPDEKDVADLKTYFSKVYPDLDFERVYSSDLKKMVKWFAVLKNNQIEIKLSEPEPEPEDSVQPAPSATPAKSRAKAEAKAEPGTGKKAEAVKEEPRARKEAAEKTAPEKAAPAASARSKAKAAPVKEEPKTRKAAPAKAASDKAAPKKKTEEKGKASAPAKKAAPKKKK
ncbi:MAG: DUF5606 domain-containing protein [Bacteroidota bacterium]|nr:DUF5606 domain-containing protein [Bacteroidota bacterium]MDP4214666.1 DUF5606 domain-containing protein [Bacteroidota bacterium]MDP4244363.1 DUF5606 domain-containing protein [Bacteroidota bacterium]MDP4255698.1 DUF5606 domain-containing protein [Bacteroidota bacterium]MDP4258925.1 DUF5606 domain-containing protein [Bacteroidota bacterium]